MLGVPSTWLPGRPFSMSKSFKINALKKSRRGKLRLKCVRRPLRAPIWGSSRQGVISHGDLSEYAEGSVLEHRRLREIQNRFCGCAASPEELARFSSSNLEDASSRPDLAQRGQLLDE